MVRGTVTEAAVRLQMSQPAATNAIHQLERRLGFKLFARVKGRLQPTTEARSLHREVEKIFGTVDVVERYAHDLRDAQAGLLTVAGTPTLTAGLMAEAVARLRAERPGVRVWIHATALTRDVVDMAMEGRVDLGVVHTPTDESNLSVEVLFETAMVCAVRRDHALAARATIGARDLVGIPIITNIRNEQIAQLLERAMPGADLPREVMIGTNQAVTACALVATGAGIALVEPMAVGPMFPGVVLIPFDPPVPIVARAVYGRDKPLSLIAQRYLALLKAVAAEGAGLAAAPP